MSGISDPFLHPVGWSAGKTGIYAGRENENCRRYDVLCAQGYQRRNPHAVVVSFAPAVVSELQDQGINPLYGIVDALQLVYAQITKGDPVGASHNPDDYFDMVAWHPYVLYQNSPVTMKFGKQPAIIDDTWKAANDSAYKVMCKYGDSGKKVLLTEMGFNDEGDLHIESAQARMLKQMFEMVRTMPYIKTVHVFRLLWGLVRPEMMKGGLEYSRALTASSCPGKKLMSCNVYAAALNH